MEGLETHKQDCVQWDSTVRGFIALGALACNSQLMYNIIMPFTVMPFTVRSSCQTHLIRGIRGTIYFNQSKAI